MNYIAVLPSSTTQPFHGTEGESCYNTGSEGGVGTLVEKEEVSREGGVQSSSQPKSPVVVIAYPVHKVKVRARGAGNGSVPAVSYLSVDVAHVEPLKIQAHLEEILVGTSERENE